MELWPGSRYPLGASWDGHGTNFAVFSEHCDGVELCVFDEQGEETRHDMTEVTASVWHGYVPGLETGVRYGYRIRGPFIPSQGHRFDATKLLLDPYAKAIDGEVDATPGRFTSPGTNPGRAGQPGEERRWSKSVVIDPSFDWEDDRAPRVPWHDTVIYETHVRGLTIRHPDVPLGIRGTYAGVAHPSVLEHLQKLSVTAIELLPVHHFVQPKHLIDRGLRNYWGYDSIGYFAPHSTYSSSGTSGGQVTEFKEMVKAIHSAGIEVILDVVYNHTGEGNHLGPTICFRGVDNRVYYRLAEHNPARYVDFTGTGNTLNAPHPQVLKLIMDSLRYWVTEMHVDGFRFDLTSALAREIYDVDHLSSFLDIIHQDPVLGEVKLIAEPWDLGEGGYQAGNFPGIWSEWNGKYRDSIRDFWRGYGPTVAEFTARFTGSSDLYRPNGRRPYASINYVTSHDGFTLADLVSYNTKHNEGNGEENHDGDTDNRSWNCGHEGPTHDPGVVTLRERQKRNLVATLALSQGVPMLLGGDELGRTQAGNNNAYCQDNEVSWMSWPAAAGANESFHRFVQQILELRRVHASFRRREWLQQESDTSRIAPDTGWFGTDGTALDAGGTVPALGIYLDGRGIATSDPRGVRSDDDDFVVLFNPYESDAAFALPAGLRGKLWSKVIDTAESSLEEPVPVDDTALIPVAARTLVVLAAKPSSTR